MMVASLAKSSSSSFLRISKVLHRHIAIAMHPLVLLGFFGYLYTKCLNSLMESMDFPLTLLELLDQSARPLAI